MWYGDNNNNNNNKFRKQFFFPFMSNTSLIRCFSFDICCSLSLEGQKCDHKESFIVVFLICNTIDAIVITLMYPRKLTRKSSFSF